MRQKAFTLIELLVVIGIIGLLASIVLVSVSGVRARARDAKRQADLKQINTAMELCFDDPTCGGAPSSYPTWPANTVMGTGTATSIGSYLRVPQDPLNQGNYQYRYYFGSSTAYCIAVQLETVPNTYFCATNKGTFQGPAPSSPNCCGVNVSQ